MSRRNRTSSDARTLASNHIQALIDCMIRDQHIKTYLDMLTLPSANLEFEMAVNEKYHYAKRENNNVGIRSMISFEEDPVVHKSMMNGRRPSEHKYYNIDLPTGFKMLKDQSDTQFNAIWLDFGVFPTLPVFEKSMMAVDLMGQNAGLFFMSFDVKHRSRSELDILDSFKAEITNWKRNGCGGVGYDRNSLSMLSQIDAYKDMLLREQGSVIEVYTIFLTRLYSRFGGLKDKLCYVNFSNDDSMITLGFCMGVPSSHVKAYQLESEAMICRDAGDGLDGSFLARTLNNTDELSDKYTEQIHTGRYYSYPLSWDRNMRICPDDKYVFIKSNSKKTGEKSNIKRVAIRSAPRSNVFKSPCSNATYNAVEWTPLNASLWKNTNEHVRRHVSDVNNAAAQASREREDQLQN